jgi:DNA-binding transcriptional LysR family regulator
MIDKLEMFLALARERHFGRAAEACGVTQPTLSSAIRSLEQSLGVQLVRRGSRFIGLTDAGERALLRARAVVGEARALRAEVRAAVTLAAGEGLTGHLRLGVIPTALPRTADLTGPLLARHPQVRVTILSCTSAEILGGIASLDLDAGLTYLDNEPLGDVAAVPVYAETYRLLCAAGSPVAAQARVTWAEVAALDLCLLTPDMQNRRILAQHLGSAVGTRVDSNSALALVSHVRTGRQMSVVPAALADLVTASGALVAVPIVAPEVQHLVGLVHAGQDMPVPVLAALIDVARRLGETAGAVQYASP